MKDITQTPKYTKQCNAIVDPLVVSYLVNRGYIGAAAAVARELQYIKGHNVYLSHSGLDPNDSEKEKEDMHTRQSRPFDLTQGDCLGLDQAYQGI